MLVHMASSNALNDYLSIDSAKKVKRKSEEVVTLATKRTRSDLDELEEEEGDIFDWPSYLAETESVGVPASLFKHMVPECMCGFEAGMKLEAPNYDYANSYWLATIIATAPPLILVRYEGYRDDNSADFWINTLSEDIHPVGWCAKNKQALKPPKAMLHKESNWYTYLIKNLTGARKASEHLFLKKSHPAHYLRSGQYVEVLDSINPTCYWLARISEVYSGRMNLHYELNEEKRSELWCYYLHEQLRPVGHGLKNGLTLFPPRGMGPFSPVQLSKITEKIVALSKRSDNTLFRSLFIGWPHPQEHNVKLGMKLEAVHPSNPSSICVASVSRVYDKFHFLVRIDDLLSAHDDDVLDSFVCHKFHGGVFPVGFCQKSGLILAQPRGFIGKFTWEAYLKYTKSEPVPDAFFGKAVSLPELQVGMKLEAVDREHPANICVSTITRVIEGHVWVHIDGDSRSDQIFPFDGHELFPPGWCASTGHELQWPRPDTLEQKDRISRLRVTATRQTRLEVLRKGKHHKSPAGSIDGRDGKAKDKDATSKEKSRGKVGRFKGRRRYTRRRIVYDNEIDKQDITDTSVAIVCINKLSEEFNTEESIKQYFHLDKDGKLPAQVVTIDDDEDEEDDAPLSSVKVKEVEKTYTSADIEYFSFIRVRPKNMTAAEEKLFSQKLKEHDANRGSDLCALPSPSAANRGDRRSLKNAVASLNRQQTKAQLIDQYKESKQKEKVGKVSTPLPPTKSSTDKENAAIEIPASHVASMSVQTFVHGSGTSNVNADTLPTELLVNSEFRVIDKVVTKEGDKNKIVLKLMRPNSKEPPCSPKTTSPTTPSTQPRVGGGTIVMDGESLQRLTNMARTHVGIDEIMRNRCNKVLSLCCELPSNPLQWTRSHVATFVENANCEQYSMRFYDEQVDGHAFLLLTANELHSRLAIPLGPAMKLHDYIFTLQQLVNDAYLHRKARKK